ncbi:hypothetical protein ACFOY2_08340 [Nonomuraea purpurea]|uniref:Uncharacterized protein n=1 Tax=Nonomuraea purpurea TaxID=1849276 RepID=A0ABV8G3V6_9ACTN
MTAPDRTPAAGRAMSPWWDPALPVADRVEALLTELTLEEKVGQLVGRDVRGQDRSGFPAAVAAAREADVSADARFLVHAGRTAFTGRDLRRIVEPGAVEVLVGTSATDLPCRGTVSLYGSTRFVGHDRRLSTPVDVRQEGSDAVQV